MGGRPAGNGLNRYGSLVEVAVNYVGTFTKVDSQTYARILSAVIRYTYGRSRAGSHLRS